MTGDQSPCADGTAAAEEMLTIDAHESGSRRERERVVVAVSEWCLVSPMRTFFPRGSCPPKSEAGQLRSPRGGGRFHRFGG